MRIAEMHYRLKVDVWQSRRIIAALMVGLTAVLPTEVLLISVAKIASRKWTDRLSRDTRGSFTTTRGAFAWSFFAHPFSDHAQGLPDAGLSRIV